MQITNVRAYEIKNFQSSHNISYKKTLI